MSLLKDMGRTCLYPMPAGRWVPQSPWRWVVEGGGTALLERNKDRSKFQPGIAPCVPAWTGSPVAPEATGTRMQPCAEWHKAAPLLLTAPCPQLMSQCPGTAPLPVPDPVPGPATPGQE